jgi:hypothetical protein
MPERMDRLFNENRQVEPPGCRVFRAFAKRSWLFARDRKALVTRRDFPQRFRYALRHGNCQVSFKRCKEVRL